MTTYPETTEHLDEMTEDQRERFTITDDRAAAWAMRKLRGIRAKQAENSQVYVDEIARLDRWLSEVNAPLDRSASYFESILSDYAARCRDDEQDGRKTISLPTGKISTRTLQPKWSVDPETFMQWARTAHPDLIRVKEEPDLSRIKDALDVHPASSGLIALSQDGEVVPGITIEPSQVSITVTPDIS